MAASRPRAPYAKGIAKRREILLAALEVISREGYRRTSVKQIAEAVGLSQAGLLHYFDSKEELFTEILRSRDERDQTMFVVEGSDHTLTPAELGEALRRLIRHNAEVPGLVQLFSQLAVEAADPQHPGHAYFISRSAELRRMFAVILERGMHSGIVTTAVPADQLARMVQAVIDGMQLQWLPERDVDMAEIFDALLTLIAPGIEHGGTPADA